MSSAPPAERMASPVADRDPTGARARGRVWPWPLAVGVAAVVMLASRLFAGPDLGPVLWLVLLAAWRLGAVADGQPWRPGWLDLAVVGLLVLDAGLCLRGAGPTGWQALTRLAGDAALYAAGRTVLATPSGRSLLERMLTLAGGALACAAIVFAMGQGLLLARTGELEATALKHLLALPVGGAPMGEWVTLFLALLPFPVLLLHDRAARPGLRGLALLAALAIALAALLSFSRGLYAALAVCYGGGALLLLHRRFRGRRAPSLAFLVGSALLGGFLLTTPVRGPLLTTVQLFRTESQVRSFEGRQAIWYTSMQLFRAQPLLGGGPARFPWLYARTARDHERGPAVGRAFSLPIELLVERGLVGTLLWGLMFGCFFLTAVRPLPAEDDFARLRRLWCAIGVLALLCRDLTYSSLLANGACSGLLFLLLALGAGASVPLPVVPPRPVLAALALALSALFARGAAVGWAESRFASFLQAFEAGDRARARTALDAAVHWWPGQPYYRLARARLLQGVPAVTAGLPAIDPHTAAATGRECQAVIDVEPETAAAWHCLGWIDLGAGRAAAARPRFERAVALQPEVALYRTSLGLAQEAAGQVSEALRTYTTALERSPRLADSQLFTDLRRRRSEAAHLPARAAVTLAARAGSRPSPTIQSTLGALHLAAGHRDRARAQLVAATRALPNLPRPYLLLGRMQDADGERHLALASIARATQLDGSDPLAWTALAVVRERSGDHTGAVAAAEQAVLAASGQQSELSIRVRRLWGVRTPLPSEVIPVGLPAYTDPTRDLGAPCQSLRRLAPRSPVLARCAPGSGLLAGESSGS